MAIENENIRADMIEASEFPELSTRYSVYAVPLTVANETVRFEGGAPEPYFIPTLLQQLGVKVASLSKEEDGPDSRDS
jgi:hypothetical protein